jgi:hypothetical protein
VPLRFEGPFRKKDYFATAADGPTPWVAWTEQAAAGHTQVHVARLQGTGFAEPVAGGQAANWPSAATAAPVEIVIHGGRPYVAMGTDVARTTPNGQAVQHVTAGLPSGCQPSLTVSAGELYALCSNQLLRLNGAGSTWEHLDSHTSRADYQEKDDLVDVTGTLYVVSEDLYRLTASGQLEAVSQDADTRYAGHAGFQGTLYAAFGGETPGPDVVLQATVRRLENGSWNLAPTPSASNEGAATPDLLEGSDGNLWAVWNANDRNGVYPPRDVHVARFAEEGTPFDFAPDPGSGSAPNSPGETRAGGGFTTPGGQPVMPEEVPELRPGACANRLVGTARRDRLVGSWLGDRIDGRAGADRLLGRGGSDCISGGSGRDYVSGGAGVDAISSGPGADRVVLGGGAEGVAAGRGNDSVNAVGGGVDRVNCGPGRDKVRVSRNDLIKGCERVIVARSR